MSFNSVLTAVAFEKATNKGTKSLAADFIDDIAANDAATVKAALRKALKKDGFTPSNTFSMKIFNTAAAIAAAGIAAADAADVMDLLKIKTSEGEKMTANKITAAVEKSGGDIAAVVKAAKDAAQPAAKKAAKKDAAKRGAKTRAAKKSGSIVPQAVRVAAQAADSKDAAAPTQSITPAAKIDRCVNAFLALTDDERAAFINAVKSEINAVIAAVNAAAASKAKTKAKKEKAA